MSQAERMRQQLAASAAFAAPRAPPMSRPPPTNRAPPVQQAQGGYMSQAQRMRASSGQQAPHQYQSQAQRQQPFDRRPSNRGGMYDDPGRNQSRDRSAPIARRVTSADGYSTFRPSPSATPVPQGRYRVNMDSTPQVDSPAFGAGQLRRRNESQSRSQPQSERASFEPREQRPQQVWRPPPKRMDHDEISKLLGNTASSGATRTYQPLSRDVNANTQRKCWHCGSVAATLVERI